MTGTRRRTARGAAVATAVLLGSMVPGAQAASGVQDIDTELSYSCDLPKGEQSVKVKVTAKVPESAQAGQVIQPEGMTLGLTLPEGELVGPADSAASTVSAEARLSVDVSQGGQQAQAEWIGTTAEPVVIPSEGDLALSAAGSVPYMKPGSSGDLMLEASALSVELTMKSADGAPAEQPNVSLSCTPDAGERRVLAIVDVSGEDALEPAPSEAWPDEEETSGAVGVPEVGAKAKPSPAADAPPCVGDPNEDLGLVAYVAGYANVTKLDGATKFPVACSKILQGPTLPVPGDPGMHIYQDSTVVLDYKGKPQLPPASGTFLTFGFMPTTATLEMTQIPPGAGADGTPDYNVKSHLVVDYSDYSFSGETVIDLDLMLRLRDVKVNGVPLDVGDNCRTSKPFTLSLKGSMTSTGGVTVGYTLATGGELIGSVTLPPFSGCGAEEDLDHIFTASLSGVPNYVKQVQGAPCAAAQHVPPDPANPAGDPPVCTDEYEPVDIPKATR
ncbi:DUF6801 domain-containing protein [Streptomyces sp. HB132]|uniref:DUF6801 domain-containing protein n=1 Tax=Streptomyces sp. HB132 TaxID=767388 RepID=UPI001DA44DDA|nr:DUF6801 domain-containing protein [Streptomyces sp. HB132]MBM7442548.1 hypothetical protein [Streptomyces sp. HB132]